ncbi:TPA: glycoside hydrolase family 31 protein [Clostridium perfringens]|uniref:Alpha-glucosidase n=1 Tax=Clostridium perfringens (strain ATCC 13124 / DSM 756 / JCM 1290 / NCIMB 6125 / NCTC 8237 / Type A) TaxID=195103 RepID=A0A0H2YQC1_CLOP1|nr:glycoside hydrolase family 31 protein [Clostridium perfringens]ABG83024.1 alpha-glucosidase [Clostridium perfringens ATCC 13124]EHK2362913.1 glycoside hydrolase family 31 protein [Clostridium perfringens]EJT5926638.1 glycoside hydrolase family 31 protein [Clostridium perfringens]EJT6481424.1 glycoside hydrolase family 31 protein [Clostridium perfringens]EJT6664489.1 glycoside hydrolase family 31 protein [Clostridium perfringens]
MTQLNYRENLNMKFKAYNGGLRVFKNYEINHNNIDIYFSNMKITLTIFENDIVKVFIGDKYEESISTNGVVDNLGKGEFIVEEDSNFVIVKGTKVLTFVDKNTTEISFRDLEGNIINEDFQPSFKDEEGNVYISKVNDCLAYYGLGEKGGDLNKKGCYTENFNTDDPETDDDSITYYKTIPFYVALKEEATYGIFFDNSFRSYFDMGKEMGDRIFFGAIGGQIQYYFIPGENIKEVVKNYTALTGRMEIPPLWSLGYQQCRFSYFSQEEVRELVKTFEEKDIPLDVVYLDIDYMDGFRVMTFKTPNFDDAAGLISDLKEKGIRTITIIDPGVNVDEEYDVFKRGKEGNHFTKKLDGEMFIGAVWPGDSAFPDFSNKDCREWWKSELKKFISEHGMDGIWNDMNEPCVFNNDHKTMLETCLHNSDNGVIEHKEFHNRYGFEMSRCSKEAQEELHPNERGFSMTRATYAGGQRYSSVWTGDNMSLWSQMRMSISMNANLGISGFSFVGNDVSGFGLDSSEELFIRWMEMGPFIPIFRNHSNMYTRRQEPWAFGPRAEKIAKKSIELRYELLPYIYDLYYISHKEGLPIFRPMIMEYEKDMNLLNMREQFMLGENMLVAPVLYEGERSKTVYLPKGSWFNYFTMEKLQGGKWYKLPCELDEILVFVKEGAIIPTYNKKFRNVKERPKNILLKVFGENAKGFHYNDDGHTMEYLEGKYTYMDIKVVDGKEELKLINNGYSIEDIEIQIIK